MSTLGTSVTTQDDDDDYTSDPKEAKKVHRWVQEIDFYETQSRQWVEKGKKILRRYKDDRSPREQRVPRYNILWSLVESTLPALYGNNPKPDIERRFRDKDDVGRIASMVLERSITYFVNESYGDAVRQAVKDRVLPGRGLVWVRYEPHFKDVSQDENEETSEEGYQLTDDVTDTNDGSGEEVDLGESENIDEKPEQEVSNELVAWDYVHWQDFGHTFGRTWDEVSAAWRKVYLVRKELEERFGEEVGKKIVLDYSPHDLKDNKYDEVEKKATIYEIWDKADKKVYWIHKDYVHCPLDEQDDPLGIDGFWPFPMPLYATLANDDCIPVPDYIEYQDQAAELDELTSRIGAITKAVKVAGVYDKSASGIERLLAEGVENQLIPVDQWAIFAEKGGMKGVMEILPMQEILQTLLGLYQAREQVKGDLYEISGSADIMRGQSDPDETAKAQGIKAQFGTMRLNDKQEQVKRFCRDLIKIGTQIIANHFSIETIKKICGVQLLTEQEKQIVQMRKQALEQFAQVRKQNPQLPPPQLPPLPDWLMKCDQEDMEELMENPTWEEIEKLLQDEITLSYKIDIETDSTIKFDQEAEKASRVQFMEAVGQFISASTKNTNPDLNPLLAKMLEFGVRGFRVGKELETAFEIAIHKLEKDASGPPKPDPEMMKMQGEQQLAQAKMQADQAMAQQRVQADLQIEAAKSESEAKRLQLQSQVDAHQGQVDAEVEKFKIELEGQMEMQKAKLESETRIVVAQIQAKASMKQAAMTKGADPLAASDPAWDQADIGDGQQAPSITDLITTVVQQLQSTLAGMTDSHNKVIQSHQDLANAVSRPKKIIRDEQGNIVGVQ